MNVKKIFINYCNELDKSEKIFKKFTNPENPFGDTKSLAFNLKELFLSVTNRSRTSQYDDCEKLLHEHLDRDEFVELVKAPNLFKLFKRWFIIHDLRCIDNKFHSVIKRNSTQEVLFKTPSYKTAYNELIGLIQKLTPIKDPFEMEAFINKYKFPERDNKENTLVFYDSKLKGMAFSSKNLEEFQEKAISYIEVNYKPYEIDKPKEFHIDMDLVAKIGDKDITNLAKQKLSNYKHSLEMYKEHQYYLKRFNIIKSNKDKTTFSYYTLMSILNYFTDNSIEENILE
jgi:hypothetical protein